MVLNTVGNVTDAISPRFETKKQAETFLNSVADRYKDAFVGLYTSLTRDPEERAKLSALIVKECVMSSDTAFNDVVTWFFVTRPVQKGNQLFRGIPISANFRTKDEANRWLAECGHDDAYIVWQSMEYYPDGRAATEADIFSGECPAKAICYMSENQQT